MPELLRAFGRTMLQNWHYKLLAVMVALVSWWYVQASDTSSRTVRVEVEWLMPAGLVTTEPLPATVLVTLSGSRNALRRLSEDELRLPVNVGIDGVTLGAHSLELEPSDVSGLPSSVVGVDIRPANLQFTLDEVEARKVTVLPVVVGDPQDGWTVEEVRLEPAVVDVRGPKVAIDTLTSVETEPIDVSGLRHDRRFEVRLALPRGVEVLGPQSIEARVDLEPRLEARVFSEVPVYVRGAPGWVVQPSVVRVHAEGPAASLRQIRDRDVVSQVFLPDVAVRGSYVVSFNETEGVRAEVLLRGEGLKVTRVEPPEIKVVRQ